MPSPQPPQWCQGPKGPAYKLLPLLHRLFWAPWLSLIYRGNSNFTNCCETVCIINVPLDILVKMFIARGNPQHYLKEVERYSRCCLLKDLQKFYAYIVDKSINFIYNFLYITWKLILCITILLLALYVLLW
jgi:hypothetical protein